MKVTPGVKRTPLLLGASDGALRMDRFYYPPGGHTHWHIHTGEQVLYGESGRGWVRFEGQERVAIEPGGVVHVPVGLRHWHGARPDTVLVHVAVTAGGDTEWLGEVLARDDDGFILTGANVGAEGLLETSVPGVYAAGDVRADSIKRCATAVGEGAAVVQFVHKRLARVAAQPGVPASP